jgi:hypothetical protein
MDGGHAQLDFQIENMDNRLTAKFEKLEGNQYKVKEEVHSSVQLEIKHM